MATAGAGTFGALLRQYRQAAALSQEALAERAGLSTDAISVIERGKRGPPRPDTVALLAQALGLTAEERARFVAAARQFEPPAAPGTPGGPPASPGGGAEGAGALPSLVASPPPDVPVLPTGTLTFLLTDVEGSTRLWEQHPAAMRQALERHDTLIEAAVVRHAGLVIRPRGEGDSRFAVFVRATDALAAAAAVQQALFTEPWPPEVVLRVRLALHTGEADLRAGDYYGSAVNRCARLRAVAHGGQTLVSLATSELVRDALPAGAELRDLGQHRLKDLTRSEHVFQLNAPGLPAEFPALRTLEGRPHNLPVQPTPLLGREDDLARLAALARRSDLRLLTLTGPGGIGKTRLALQLAADLLDQFADGTYFVDLAPVRDPALVIAAVAAALGLRENASQPLAEIVPAYLRDKALLLVLDNFEQIVEAAPLVGTLLAGCPHLRIVVTSRTVLQIYGEHEYPVPPLALPPRGSTPPLEQLTQYAAVVLFIQRAQAVQPSFTVTNATAPAVAEICARLDGLPLAIELAAARVRLLPPPALLARLANRLGTLTGGARDVPARQQTLRAAIDWSYRLLSAPEQAFFARLAVFAGGRTLAAIEAVCLTPDEPQDALAGCDVLVEVASLVEKSLLRPEEEEEASEPRFVLLETLHEYAREQLTSRGETETFRARHAAYFVALAEDAEPHLWGGVGVGTWLARLDAEHDNLRAVLQWAQEHEERREVGLRLSGALSRFWMWRGHFSEGRRWLEGFCAAVWPGAERASAAVVAAQAKALHGAGVLAWRQGDFAQAALLQEESLALRRELGDKQGIARSLHYLGSVTADGGDYARATALYEESLALSRELGDTGGIARSLGYQGHIAIAQGDYARATALYEESLALLREQEDKPGISASLNSLGNVASSLGDFARASVLYEESLTIDRELGDKPGIAVQLNNLGSIAWRQGDHVRARVLHEESLAINRELGVKAFIALSLSNLGYVAERQGDYAQAALLQEESLALFRELGDKRSIAINLEGLARVAAGAETAPEARQRAVRLLGAADALRVAIGAPLPPSDRPDMERAVAALHAGLAEVVFEAAWAEGQAMPLEQAIAYALEGAPSTPGTPGGTE
jgi:predicted ATPase/class 3 adenylate cyclase/DNA-binding XRE family transcriptional regulator